MIRRLAAFGFFCYDFVVGDDWRLAAAVVVALGLTAAAATTTLPAWVVTPVIVLCALILSARREARRARGLLPKRR